MPTFANEMLHPPPVKIPERMTSGSKAAIASTTENSHIKYERRGASSPGSLPETTTKESLWQEAVAKVSWKLPRGLELDSSNTSTTLVLLYQEANERKDNVEKSHRRWRLKSGAEVTVRDIWGNIMIWVKRFQIIGDIAIQYDPGHASLPWALVRLLLTAAASEHETHGAMLEGMELVSHLITQYLGIEQLYTWENYAGEKSKLANQLHHSLVGLYIGILRYLTHSVNYFDSNKVKRFVRGLNPTSIEEVDELLTGINEHKKRVDSDASHLNDALTRDGINVLQTGQEYMILRQQRIINAQHSLMDGQRGLAEGQQELKAQQMGLQEQAEYAAAKQEEQMQCLQEIFQEWQTSFHIMMNQVSEIYDMSVTAEVKQETKEISRWLSTIDPQTYHAAVREGRLESSGRWLLEHPDFQIWKKSTKSSMLWMHGLLGTGKTKLVSIIIDHLEAESNNVFETSRLAYFYCSRNEAGTEIDKNSISRSEPLEVFRSIVKQLATNKGGSGLEPVLTDKYRQLQRSRIEEPQRLSRKECVEMIISLVKDIPTSIIIDALDECKPVEIRSLILGLDEIVGSSKNVKVFLSTRYVAAVVDCLNQKDYRSLEVSANKNSGDIANFIDAELEKMIQEKRLALGKVSDTLRIEIRDTLTWRADSMFWYASLQLNFLSDPIAYQDEDGIKTKLYELPDTLRKAYVEIIGDIQNPSNSLQSRLIAQNSLKWLLCAQEPLPCAAFLQAVSPRSDIEVDQELITRLCRNLVIHNQENDVFEFAHLSVREYLEETSDYGSDEQHLVAAESCLNNLEAVFFSSATNKKTAYSRKAFSRYASLFWPLHYQNIDFDRFDVRKEALKNKLKTLLIRSSGVSPAFKLWISQIEGMAQDLPDCQSLVMKLGSLRALPDEPDTPLFTACVFGFADLVKQFRRNKTFNFEQCNVHGQAALCLAAENNQLDTVKALLTDLSKSHAPPLDVNRVNELAVIQFAEFTQISSPSVICYASALQAAAAQGHVGMIKHLLERGARVDLVAGYYGNALQTAALRGHDSIVELLLEEYGAEPNSQGGFHGNALQAAAISGNAKSVTLLMDKFALVSAPGGHYGSAIMAAICSGSKAIVEALLLQGANINVKSSLYGTPLQRAAEMDNQELLDLLIANDAQINAHNTTSSEDGQAGFDSALAKAAWGGHHKIVHLLLQHGAEADTTARENAFHLFHQAAARGMVELAEYCLNQEDCDINMTTTQGQKYYSNQDKMTPLSFACAEGHLDMVRLLLDNGASIEFLGDTLTTLWLAARRGNSDIIKRLIRQSTITQGKAKTQQFIDRVIPKFEHSALYEAAWSGSVDAIATLLDNNAKYAGNWTSINPLHIATIENRQEAVRLLLERHAQNRIRGEFHTDSGDINGKTPLIYAIEHNHRAVFEILLEHDANTSANDNSGNSTLHYAVWRDRREITEKLLSACPRDRLQVLLEQRNNRTNTVLNEALERGHYQIVKVLLAYGARWHSDEGRESHLHLAVTKDENPVRECIKAFEGSDELDAFLNSRTPDRRVPLHVAAENNKAKIVQILLDNGADPAALDNMLSTALFCATDRNHVECARVILNFVQKNSDSFNKFLNTRNAYARTALDEAIRLRHLASVQLLLDFGADFVNPGFNKETPLILTALDGRRAGYQNCASIANLLLEKAQEKNDVRPFIDACTEEGRTALWEASNNNIQEVVALLREWGADYAISSKEEVTPLHISCWNSHQKIVEVLLESSSMDPQQGKFRNFLDQRDGWGRTALSAASCRGQVGIVFLLLEKYHADYSIAAPSYVPNSLFTPLHEAVFEGHTTTVEALLQVASLDPDHSKAQQFLDARQTSNLTSRTALMDAALRGMSSIVEALLTHGADFTLRDEGQATALHAALWSAGKHNECVAIVKALISTASKCSDKLKMETFLNAKNKDTKTALMDAAERGHASVISVLLKAPGLDYAVLDKDGFTALHWAAYRNKHEAVAALLYAASKDNTNNGRKFKDFLNQRGNANNASAIMDTATAGHWELTKLLLEGYGAEYETYDKSGNSPLHGAVDRDSYEDVKVLLDFASKDKDNHKFIRFLNKVGRSGQTALDRATAGNKGHLMGLLKSYGAA